MLVTLTGKYHKLIVIFLFYRLQIDLSLTDKKVIETVQHMVICGAADRRKCCDDGPKRAKRH